MPWTPLFHAALDPPTQTNLLSNYHSCCSCYSTTTTVLLLLLPRRFAPLIQTIFQNPRLTKEEGVAQVDDRPPGESLSAAEAARSEMGK